MDDGRVNLENTRDVHCKRGISIDHHGTRPTHVKITRVVGQCGLVSAPKTESLDCVVGELKPGATVSFQNSSDTARETTSAQRVENLGGRYWTDG